MRAIEMQQEYDEAEVLELLVESGELNDVATGIAKQVMAKGEESLTDKQRYVYDRFVRTWFNLECSRCKIPMPTNEVIYCLRSYDFRCGGCV